MEVKISDSFFDSLKVLKNKRKFWKIEFWKQKMFDLKNSIWSLRKLYKPAVEFRAWDYNGFCLMMKTQVLLMSNQIEKYSIEVDEDRLPKVQRMKKFVELMDNFLNDNYAERCGYDYDADNIIFEPIKGTEYSEIKTVKKPGKEHVDNNKSFYNGKKLAEKEWDEMMDILKNDMQTWWS